MHRWARVRLATLTLLLAAGPGCRLARTGLPPRPLGLTVGAEATLLKDGRPFRGFGVNYFDAFSRTLKDPSDASYREGFAELASLGIPFARIMGCGFWPKDWELYLKDKERYFTLFDGVVRAAEEHRIGLIPSLFWHSATVPDLVGEPREAWGNPRSKTHAFMRRYVREVVTRYNDSPAIWGWEFGNEYNLDADLPNAAQHRPKIVPQLGTPATRSARDDLTHDLIATAFEAFASEVRTHDPHRIISTGNSLPRPSAWHQWKEKSWAPDTPEQFAERLLLDNPYPVDVVSVHAYYDAVAGKRFGRELRPDELLATAVRIARQAGKPLFVGEFGAWAGEGEGQKPEKEQFAELLASIERAGVPLAALWVYDFAGQARDWNVTKVNARAYQIEAVAEANRRLRARRLRD